jgi:hypothetical protein
MNFYYSKTQKRKFDIVLGLVFSLVSVVLFVFLEQAYIYILLFCVGVLLFLFSLYKGSIYSKIRFAKDKKFNEEYEISFNDQGIHFKTTSINSEIKWNFYTRVWETQKFFYIFYGKDIFSLIPKRAFKKDENITEFRELVKGKIHDYNSI